MASLDIKEKFVNFFKNRVVIICLVATLLYVISGYINHIEIILAAAVSVTFIFLSLQESLCLFLFMHNFTISNIANNLCFTIIFISFAVVLLVKYIIGLIKKKYAFHPVIVGLLSFILVFSLLISIPNGVNSGALLYIVYFPLIYLLFVLRDEFDIRQAIGFMLFGLILTCALAWACKLLPNWGYFIDYQRFQAFAINPNYLYMRCLFLITYYMYLNLTNQLKFLEFCLIYAVCAIITLLTLSKTGIVLLLLFSAIYFIIFLKQDFKTRAKYGLIIIFLIAIGVFIFRDKIIQIINRFLYQNGNFWNSLLTDRDTIWKNFLSSTFSSPVSVLFGKGLIAQHPYTASQNSFIAPHNFYIFLLYRFGIVGSVLIGVAVYLIVKEIVAMYCPNNRKEFLTHRPTFLSSLPLIWFLLESMCDNTFYCFNITYLFLAIFILFSLKPQKNKHN